MKRHYSPKTGKMEICHAKDGNCPLGGSDIHFEDNDSFSENYADDVNRERAKGKNIEEALTIAKKRLTNNLLNSSFDKDRIKAYIKHDFKNDRRVLSENTEVKKELLEAGRYTLLLQLDKNPSIAKLAREYDKEVFKRERKEKEILDKKLLEYRSNTNTSKEEYEKIEERVLELSERSAFRKKKNFIKIDQNNLSQCLAENEGFSYSPAKESLVSVGIAYSGYPEKSKAIKGLTTQKEIDKYIEENKNLLGTDNTFCIGGWYDKAGDTTYLDISNISFDINHVKEECRNKDQIAFFMIDSGKEVVVDRSAKSGQ